MDNLKLTKFRQSPDGRIRIRKECFNGKCVVFGLPGDLLSVIQEEVDFDAESEHILEEVKDTNQHRFFEYRENGFIEVGHPKWFKLL